jgi:hypothetical protein
MFTKVLQEPGRYCHLRSESGLGIRSIIPGPQPRRLATAGTKPKAQRRYRKAKATKQRGQGDRKSECLALVKLGTRPVGQCWIQSALTAWTG